MKQEQAELRISDEIADIVHEQVNRFNFSPMYILDHYRLGESDLILRFKQDKVGILKNMELMSRNLIDVRCKILSTIIVDLYKKYPGIMNKLDVVMPICLSDLNDKIMRHIPCLTFSKHRSSNNILIPSINNLGYYKEYEYVDMLDRPLFHKIDQMCVAASLTNIYWNGKGIEHNQRLQVGELAATNPTAFFCRIMKPPKFGDEEWVEVCDKVKDSYPNLYSSECFVHEEDRVDMSTQLKYKFQLCMDGHTCAWARLPWQLKSNSVTMKIRKPHADYVEWFYYLLRPGKEFLEVDMDDLEDVYEYIRHEPEHQLDISNAASSFVDKYLNNDLAQRIFLYTLLCLGKKQTIHLGDLE